MFSRGETERRYVRARELMSQRGIDGLLISGEENFRYLAGASTSLAGHYSPYQAVYLHPADGQEPFHRDAGPEKRSGEGIRGENYSRKSLSLVQVSTVSAASVRPARRAPTHWHLFYAGCSRVAHDASQGQIGYKAGIRGDLTSAREPFVGIHFDIDEVTQRTLCVLG